MDIGKYAGFEIELHDPGIATLTFNEPDRLNGMSVAMKRDLIEALTQAQLDNAVRVALFSGEGRAFCAGDDLKGYSTHASADRRMPVIPPGHDSAIGTYDGLRTVSQALNRTLRDFDKMTIAALNGVAVQTGLSLALSCDFRIASERARLGSATLRFALLPDEGGHHLLVQHLGLARALDFVMRKRIVDAAEAFDLGLVHEVVPHEELMPRAMALATELAHGPQTAMRMLKRALYQAAELTFAQACDDIAARTAVTDHHHDSREGVAAFRERREPRFNQQKPQGSGH